MNQEAEFSMVAGILAGLLCAVILKFFQSKKNGKKCEFDERQELIRGKGFKFGFFSMIICSMLVSCYSTIMEKSVFDVFTASVLSIIVGVGVFAVYCIWKDAYFSFKENRKKMLILFAFLGLANILAVISQVLAGEISLVENGEIQPFVFNIMCGVLYAAIFGTFFVKEIAERMEK